MTKKMNKLLIVSASSMIVLAAGCGSSDNNDDASISCNTFNGDWYTDNVSLDLAVGTTQLVDFETKGDGITIPTAGVEVPVDEYLDCCGIKVEYDGIDPSGRLIWAGNPVGGFSLRSACGVSGINICNGSVSDPNTVKVSFVNGASAVGGKQSAVDYTVYIHNDSSELSSMTGAEWLGYASSSPVSFARFGRPSGTNLESLTYQECS